jgi:hypothetical protein
VDAGDGDALEAEGGKDLQLSVETGSAGEIASRLAPFPRGDHLIQT